MNRKARHICTVTALIVLVSFGLWFARDILENYRLHRGSHITMRLRVHYATWLSEEQSGKVLYALSQRLEGVNRTRKVTIQRLDGETIQVDAAIQEPDPAAACDDMLLWLRPLAGVQMYNLMGTVNDPYGKKIALAKTAWIKGKPGEIAGSTHMVVGERCVNVIIVPDSTSVDQIDGINASVLFRVEDASEFESWNNIPVAFVVADQIEAAPLNMSVAKDGSITLGPLPENEAFRIYGLLNQSWLPLKVELPPVSVVRTPPAK